MAVVAASDEPTVALVPPGTGKADPNHSSVSFRVKHMAVATVKGRSGGILDSWSVPRIALRVWGEVDREDFGLVWNHVLEAGGALVARRVQIEVDVSAVKVPGRETGTVHALIVRIIGRMVEPIIGSR